MLDKWSHLYEFHKPCQKPNAHENLSNNISLNVVGTDYVSLEVTNLN